VRQLFLKKSIFPFFLTIILLLLFLSCEKEGNVLVDSAGSSPILMDANFSLSTVNTDTINIGSERNPYDLLTIRGIASVKVVHPEGETGIKSVTYTVLKNLDSSPNGKGVLQDNGVSPDIAANDSIFSGYAYFQVYRIDIGNYCTSITSESNTGHRSNTVLFSFKIVRFNHKPVISNLQAKDTLRLGALHKLTIQVSDSDGLGDIYSVGYFSLKPDGSYANDGKLIPMFDDGRPAYPSGDLVANDGIYSYLTNVPYDAQIGTYTYTFYAIDRSRDTSNSIIHLMEIRP
jgi:hypothetical protein